MIKTFKYRIKDSIKKSELCQMADSVNFVWNYCNQTSIEFLDKKGIWITGYHLDVLTRGCSKLRKRRFQFKKRKLAWRSGKRSLGWIPFRDQDIKINKDRIRFYGHSFRFWNSLPIEGVLKCGSFNQDSKGRWYVSLCCEVDKPQRIKSGVDVGIDLGLKTIAVLSNSESLSRENITNKYAVKLAKICFRCIVGRL